MFKWICLTLAAVFAVVLLWLGYDLKRDVTASIDAAKYAVNEANQAVATVNERLPEIVSEVKEGTETLSELADDVELIKSIAGIKNDEQDRGFRGLANYANEIQKLVTEKTEGKKAIILIEKVFGSDLKEVETVEEFLVGLNKEMIGIILPIAKSKQEILYRACQSAPPRRKPYFIQFPETEPVSLETFIRQHHPESASLPVYQVE